jgi:hypothetical protein
MMAATADEILFMDKDWRDDLDPALETISFLDRVQPKLGSAIPRRERT